MTRRCSHCSNNGSEGGGGVRLFGVKLTDGCVMKKSASMGNLSSPASSSPLPPRVLRDDGYLSDDPAANRRGGDRKKGVPWTEEEHRMFLTGLQKLGKGDWRGIAQKYVMTRTPTQVASHAQKYFIRQSNSNRRKRRSSLFDMDPDTAMDPPYMPEEHALLPSHEEEREYEDSNVLPSLNLSLGSECSRPIESTQEDKIFIKSDKQSVMGFNGYPNGYPPAIPGYIPVYLPVPYPVWRSASPLIKGNTQNRGGTSLFPRILKPVPIHSKEPVNVDALVGLSQLNLGEAERLHNYLPLSLWNH